MSVLTIRRLLNLHPFRRGDRVTFYGDLKNPRPARVLAVHEIYGDLALDIVYLDGDRETDSVDVSYCNLVVEEE